MSYNDLAFGTAGIRGIMGDGAGELNLSAIAAISHSLAKVFAEEDSGGKVIFCYDSRQNGKAFAALAAEIIGSYGFEVYLTPAPAPTPFLSFAIKTMDAVGGVNITASHNPKEYNGYKAYARGGAQIDVAFANRVQEYLQHFDLPATEPTASVQELPQKVYEAYEDRILENLCLDAFCFGEFFALYTPLHGAAGDFMRRIAAKGELPLSFVEAEMIPDGAFPGLPKPNPDTAEVFQKSRLQGKAPLLLANDPDGDRLGAMVKIGEDYRLLTGNEIGILLLNYLLETTEAVRDKFVVKSLVSTSFAETLAKAHGVAVKNVLVGFRYIAQKIAEDEAHFLFGFEESGGYLAHSHAGDKDGIEAACLLLKAGAHYQQQGKTLVDVLKELYHTYGEVENRTVTIDMSLEKSRVLMSALRQNVPTCFGDQPLTFFEDYARRSDDLHGDLIAFHTPVTEIILRPSGTEPKMKVYCTLTPESGDVAVQIAALFRQYS